MITLPTNMGLLDWADQLAVDLEHLIPVQRLNHPGAWQIWAAQYLGLPTVDGYNIPNPYAYDDWRAWAERLCEVLN